MVEFESWLELLLLVTQVVHRGGIRPWRFILVKGVDELGRHVVHLVAVRRKMLLLRLSKWRVEGLEALTFLHDRWQRRLV